MVTSKVAQGPSLAGDGAFALGVASDADGEEQPHAVEQGATRNEPAKLLDAGNVPTAIMMMPFIVPRH